MKKIFFICLIMVLTSACFVNTSNADEPTVIPHDTKIVLVRTSCFVSCPIYKLTIHGDGRIEFVGKGDVAGMGVHVKTISPETVASILEELDKINFNELDNISFADLDTPPVTHNPAIILRVTQENKSKGFYHTSYYDRAKDEMVTRLVDKIVGLTEITDWAYFTFKGL